MTSWQGTRHETISVHTNHFVTDTRGSLIRRVNEEKVKGGTMVYESFQHSPALPEKPVKIGDFWEQQSESRSRLEYEKRDLPEFSMHNLDTTKWRLSGVATVRGHRCVVIEGIREGRRIHMGALPKSLGGKPYDSETRTKARIVKYFDHSMGFAVETVTFSFAASQGAAYSHDAEFQVIESLIE
jgi:hypothetical protein